MSFFPIFIRLSGKRCLVIGGGSVGTRKVEALRDGGADVAVVSERVSPELLEQIERGEVTYLGERFSPELLNGVFLCISAVDDRQSNDLIAAECKRRGILVNVVDLPESCDFFTPSVVRRGDLVVAASSGGAAPSATKRVRREIEGRFGDEYRIFVKIIGKIRAELKKSGVSGDGLSRIMNKIADLPLPEMIASGRMGDIPALVSETLKDEKETMAVDIDSLVRSSFGGGS